MPLPASRDETAVTGALVKSALVNSIQDSIIGLHNLARGARVLQLGGPCAIANTGTDWIFDAVGGVPYNPHWSHVTSNPGEVLVFPIPVCVGDRITAARGHIKLGTATAAGIQMQLIRSILDTGVNTASTLTDAAASTAHQSVAFLGITPAVVAAGEQWSAMFYAGAGAIDKRVYGCEVTIEHPL
jgi:hypothetical protein